MTRFVPSTEAASVAEFMKVWAPAAVMSNASPPNARRTVVKRLMPLFMVAFRLLCREDSPFYDDALRRSIDRIEGVHGAQFTTTSSLNKPISVSLRTYFMPFLSWRVSPATSRPCQCRQHGLRLGHDYHPVSR